MIFSFLRNFVSKINAWQIRMVVLACLVIFVGGGSQALITAFADSYIPHSAPAPVVSLAHSDTLPDVHLNCRAVVRRSANGIDIEISSHYAFTLHCTANTTGKKPITD